MLGFRGGGLNALSRHAVAALLNAAHPSIDPVAEFDTTAEVIAAWQAAFDTGDRQAMERTKDAFEDSNEADCPINGRILPLPGQRNLWPFLPWLWP